MNEDSDEHGSEETDCDKPHPLCIPSVCVLVYECVFYVITVINNAFAAEEVKIHFSAALHY